MENLNCTAPVAVPVPDFACRPAEDATGPAGTGRTYWVKRGCRR